MLNKSYNELRKLPTFEERFNYLKLNNQVGESTFGFDRYLNQKFYTSKEWKQIRNEVIIRDEGCDLSIPGKDIFGKIIIHHMNPIVPKDIQDKLDWILDPNFLICVSNNTHQALHYGDINLLQKDPIERQPNDTKLW